MSRVRRVRFLAVAVLALAALLIVLSRRVGQGGAGAGDPVRRGATAADGTGSRTGRAAAAAVPDLSFWEKLGETRSGQGSSAAPPGRSRLNGEDTEAPPAGAFVIQVLATRDAAQANQVRKQVVDLGLPARVIEAEADGKAIYRVRVGSYRERRTAVAWARKIEARIGLTPWVLQEAR